MAPPAAVQSSFLLLAPPLGSWLVLLLWRAVSEEVCDASLPGSCTSSVLSQRQILDKTPTPCLKAYSEEFLQKSAEAHIAGIESGHEVPHMLMLLGGSGSGKSTFMRHLAKHGINVSGMVAHGLDDYLKYLPEFQKTLSDPSAVYKDAADACYGGGARVLEQERKLKEFMGVKGRDRAKDLGDAAKARKEKVEGKERPEVVINQYEAVFTQLKEVCGIEDTSELTDRFIETEDRNFSLFNLVNELNTNIESLKEQIARVEQQITEYNKQSEEMDKERTQKFKQLEVQLSRAEASASKFGELATERRTELGKLVTGINGFVDKIGCDRGPIAEMLGEKDVNERNIMQFLGVIEQRANELLLMQARLDFKAQKKWEADADRLINEHSVDAIGSYDPTVDLGEKPVVSGVLGAGPKIQAAQGDLGAPKLMIGDADYDDDDEEDDDEMLRPLTHSELKAKIIRGQKAKADVGSAKDKEVRRAPSNSKSPP
jgi:uridine kinase